MNNKLIVCVASALVLNTLYAGPAAAENRSSRSEVVGLGSGAIVGAAAAGPIGFVVGAGLGALLGDKMHQRKIEEQRLIAELAESDHREANLNRQLASVQRELDRISAFDPAETLAKMLSGSIELQVMFRTADSSIDGTTEQRLAELATLLASVEGIKVHLDGYADERGDESYNETLSEQRAATVREQLIAAGMNPQRIETIGRGELASANTENDLDGYAMQRRVSIRLTSVTSDGAVAQSQR